MRPSSVLITTYIIGPPGTSALYRSLNLSLIQSVFTHGTDNRFPLHDLDISGQVYDIPDLV